MKTVLLGLVLAGLAAASQCVAAEEHLAGNLFQKRKKEHAPVYGLPNVSDRSLAEEYGVEVFTDLLVWRAAEAPTDNWAQVFSTTTLSSANLVMKLLKVDFDWNAGFRIGADYRMKHDQWDTQLAYTWFRTSGRDRASTSIGEITSSFFANILVGNPDAAGLGGASYRNANILWKIDFNMFDWELGRKYWVSSGLSLRPFTGLKGGWIHQAIRTKWANALASATILDPAAIGVATENLKNDYWGLGPSFGLNTKWKLGALARHAFSLFGDFSGAIMWGQWSFADVYRNEVPQKIVLKESNVNGGSSMLRTFTGFAWDFEPIQNRFAFSMRLGYEAQFWLDQLQFYSSPMGRLSNELTLQGGSLDFRFDF